MKLADILPSTGERIRAVRQDRGLTQKQLGELCGIAEPTIRSYELCRLNPKYKTLEKIAFALKVPVPVLLARGPRPDFILKDWKSDKDARLSMQIDSGLLEDLRSLAEIENLSLEDEVEKLLYDGVFVRFEELDASREVQDPPPQEPPQDD